MKVSCICMSTRWGVGSLVRFFVWCSCFLFSFMIKIDIFISTFHALCVSVSSSVFCLFSVIPTYVPYYHHTHIGSRRPRFKSCAPKWNNVILYILYYYYLTGIYIIASGHTDLRKIYRGRYLNMYRVGTYGTGTYILSIPQGYLFVDPKVPSPVLWIPGSRVPTYYGRLGSWFRSNFHVARGVGRILHSAHLRYMNGLYLSRVLGTDTFGIFNSCT